MSVFRSGKAKSCGCSLFRVTLKVGVGERYGRYVVIDATVLGKGNTRSVECRCDCGKVRPVRIAELLGGLIKSCGCYADEKKLPAGVAVANELYTSYRQGAVRRGLAFELTYEEFFRLSQLLCHYCGGVCLRRAKRKHKHGVFEYNGVDRVDSTKGYVEGNMVPCCTDCNFGKRRLTKEQFLRWVDRVYRHNNQEKSYEPSKVA